MKVSKWMLGALAMSLVVACTPKKEENKTTEAQESAATVQASESHAVLLDQSTINWEGKKVGIDSKHHGTISLKSGDVAFELSTMELKGGVFVIDMNSINNLDLEGDMKGKLEGHLKSADFFDVEKYPEARFEITSAEKLDENGRYKVVGNLTMKEATHGVEFTTSIKYDEATRQLTADSDEIVLDRTKWGVNYNSKNIFKDLKDNIIDDQISLKLHIVAQM